MHGFYDTKMYRLQAWKITNDIKLLTVDESKCPASTHVNGDKKLYQHSKWCSKDDVIQQQHQYERPREEKYHTNALSFYVIKEVRYKTIATSESKAMKQRLHSVSMVSMWQIVSTSPPKSIGMLNHCHTPPNSPSARRLWRSASREQVHRFGIPWDN